MSIIELDCKIMSMLIQPVKMSFSRTYLACSFCLFCYSEYILGDHSHYNAAFFYINEAYSVAILISSHILARNVSTQF